MFSECGFLSKMINNIKALRKLSQAHWLFMMGSSQQI